MLFHKARFETFVFWNNICPQICDCHHIL